MPHSTLTSKGQTTIPKAVRDWLHLRSGDRIDYVRDPNGTVRLLPTTLPLDALKGCVPPPPRAASLEEIEDGIEAGAVADAGYGDDERR